MDQPHQLSHQIHIEPHSSVNVCPINVKAYSQCTESVKRKKDGSVVSSLDNHRPHIPVCANGLLLGPKKY